MDESSGMASDRRQPPNGSFRMCVRPSASPSSSITSSAMFSPTIPSSQTPSSNIRGISSSRTSNRSTGKSFPYQYNLSLLRANLRPQFCNKSSDFSESLPDFCIATRILFMIWLPPRAVMPGDNRPRPCSNAWPHGQLLLR